MIAPSRSRLGTNGRGSVFMSPLLDISQPDFEDAWLRVQENHGCAGSDGVTIDHFAERYQSHLSGLRARIDSGAYRPLPLLKIVVQKKPGSNKMRTLLVPAVADRVLQTAVARYLSRSFEDEFLEASFGYRAGRSVGQAIAEPIGTKNA